MLEHVQDFIVYMPNGKWCKKVFIDNECKCLWSNVHFIWGIDFDVDPSQGYSNMCEILKWLKAIENK